MPAFALLLSLRITPVPPVVPQFPSALLQLLSVQGLPVVPPPLVPYACPCGEVPPLLKPSQLPIAPAHESGATLNNESPMTICPRMVGPTMVGFKIKSNTEASPLRHTFCERGDLPFEESSSDAATQAPRDSFHIVLYDLFKICPWQIYILQIARPSAPTQAPPQQAMLEQVSLPSIELPTIPLASSQSGDAAIRRALDKFAFANHAAQQMSMLPAALSSDESNCRRITSTPTARIFKFDIEYPSMESKKDTPAKTQPESRTGSSIFPATICNANFCHENI